tara:strand:+ start:1930 stop:2445 length:516 start_codon:yes stop_codon:yes gene_type:complete
MWHHIALSTLVMASYVVVIGDPFGAFVVTSASYFDSPWWVGLPPESARLVTALQLPAAAGCVYWYLYVARQDLMAGYLDAGVSLFLIASALWPWFSYHALTREAASWWWAAGSVASLGVAALCFAGFVGASFAMRMPPLPLLSVLWAGMIVVLADGVGWSSALLARRAEAG